MGPLVGRLSPLSNERVLVTGMSGFKGSWLAVWLRLLGCDVVGLSLEPDTSPSLFDDCAIVSFATHYVVDLRDREAVFETVNKVRPTAVFHLAAQPLVLSSLEDPLKTFDTNVVGSLNLLEAVRRCPTARALVYVTSDKCYANDESGRPYAEDDALGGRDPYSASKAAAEIVFSSYVSSFLEQRDDFGAVSVRSGNVIGGGDWSPNRLLPDCIRALHSNGPVIVRSPQAVRPWQHVLDPLHGYLMLAADLLRNPRSRQGAWNFGPDPKSVHTVEDVVRSAITSWGHGQLVVDESAEEVREAHLLLLDSAKSRSSLGWEPLLHFSAAIDSTVRWYSDYLAGCNARELCEKDILKFMEGTL